MRTYRPGVAHGTRTSESPAAVLVALFEESGDTHVVLTRRSAELRSHTGQVSFPGGRLEPGESPEQAALRESFEEVGMSPGAVEVIGRLSRLTTVTGETLITPVVGVLAQRPRLRPNPSEVERVFDVSISDLLSDSAYRQERWRVGEGSARPMHFFEVDGETVWGATARILVELLSLLVSPWQARPSH
jgi:8-oxo-dGTP pyrophosphatase MutT (NUDIX family)